METGLILVVLAAAVLLVTAAAARFDAPAPLVLIAVGAAASYIPFTPDIRLTPDIVLLGLLPPLLYSTAISASLVDFNANRRTILFLSIGLVVFTTLGIGLLVHEVLDIGWAAAIAVGAVVAPPDAVAATAIGRRIGLPRRIVTILEGESLLNDATALVALRTAIAAGGIAAWHVGLDFVVAAGGGVLVGVVAYLLVAEVRKQIKDPIFDTAVSLVVPFAAYLGAEEVGGSGVLAVVVAGLLLGHRAPVLQTAQSRIAEGTNWRTIAFVLENAVFLLIGLQASVLLRDVGRSGLSPARIVVVCGGTLVGVIVLRMVWVFLARFFILRPDADGRMRPPPWRYTLLLGWAGMRGVVTLAAAFVLPDETPHREILLLIAFTVVAGTLFVQGLTLPMLARLLDVPSPDPMEDALARATLLQQASKAGFKALEELDYEDPHGIKEMIRARIDQRNFAAWERLGTTADQESPSDLYARTRLAMIAAERGRILAIRDSGKVASEVVADVLTSLDVEESMIDRAEAARSVLRVASGQRSFSSAGCDDLRAHPAPTPRRTEETVGLQCADCLRDGTTWVALRECLDCGNVACCDSSPLQHADRHFRDTTHPVMASAEPEEDWRWCYVHHLTA